MSVLHALALDYFVAGVEACDEDNIERGGALLQIALTLAERASVETSGDHDLDVLTLSVINLITTSRDLTMLHGHEASTDFVDVYLQGLMERIFAYWDVQE